VSFLQESSPGLETYWRAIILLGRNSASYKFALGKSLLDFARAGKSFVSLDEFAVPFAANIVEHLKSGNKQMTAANSTFIQHCQRFVDGQISYDDLIAATVRYGFVNVIDAFHVVNRDDIPIRFFTDDRKASTRGITLTDQLLQLSNAFQVENLPGELEARWRLVETAWALRISQNLLVVSHDNTNNFLVVKDASNRRIAVTSSRDALNGYQKGKCFYCFRDISVVAGSNDLAQVDHFLPHTLINLAPGQFSSIDGIWNLVLACGRCNGSGEKSSLLPAFKRYFVRWCKPNEFYIESRHPLHETLEAQTGITPDKRRKFLLEQYRAASGFLVHEWACEEVAEAIF